MADKVKSGDDDLNYFYRATILREGKRAIREGTLKAESASAALSAVYALAGKWKRPIIEVVLYEILDTGETEWVMKSTIGALPKFSEDDDTTAEEDSDESDGDSDDTDDEYGYMYGYPCAVPISSANNSSDQSFNTWEIGSYFKLETFATFRPADTEAK